MHRRNCSLIALRFSIDMSCLLLDTNILVAAIKGVQRVREKLEATPAFGDRPLARGARRILARAGADGRELAGLNVAIAWITASCHAPGRAARQAGAPAAQ